MARKDFKAYAPGDVVLGRYVVEKTLGLGSMAVVYKCRDKQLKKRSIALKVLFTQVTEEVLARFRKEVLYSYEIVHKNVVRTYEFIEEPDLTAITMEYIDGGDLRDLLVSEEELSIDICVDVLTQLCLGVNAIHEANIIHRDLKPENVLFTKEGVAKIADFSIAWTKNATQLTSHGGILGSLSYISPEYLKYGKLDNRADLYALGVIGYELLTKEFPYDGDNLSAMVAQRGEKVPLPHHIREDCPEALSLIVAKALDPSPKKRYQSVLDMYREIDEFSRETGIGLESNLSLSGAIERIATETSPTLPFRAKMARVLKGSFRSSLMTLVALTIVVIAWGIPNISNSRGAQSGGVPGVQSLANAKAVATVEPGAIIELAKLRKQKEEMQKELAELIRQREEVEQAKLEKKEKEAEELKRFEEERKKKELELAKLAEKRAEVERIKEQKKKQEEEQLARLEKERKKKELELAELAKQREEVARATEEKKKKEAKELAELEKKAKAVAARLAKLESSKKEGKKFAMAKPPAPVIPKTVQATPVVVPVTKEASSKKKVQYSDREYQVKAALLYHFAENVEWPSDSSKSSASKRVICILGQDRFGSYLYKKDSIRVKRFPAGSKSSDIKNCHLAFVNGEERGNTNDLVAWLHRSHVLTVTERLSSGIINFYLHRGKVRFDIDSKQASRAGVHIARRLVKISKKS